MLTYLLTGPLQVGMDLNVETLPGCGQKEQPLEVTESHIPHPFRPESSRNSV